MLKWNLYLFLLYNFVMLFFWRLEERLCDEGGVCMSVFVLLFFVCVVFFDGKKEMVKFG